MGSCGHLVTPVSPGDRVVYPGGASSGAWQYYAEWSGLDDNADANEGSR